MKIHCLGDSLTVGYLVDPSLRWTALLNGRVNENGRMNENDRMGRMNESGRAKHDARAEVQVINRGINGDTTAGMLARLDRDVIGDKPDLVIILGGTNDLLMEKEAEAVKSNLTAIIDRLRRCGISPIIITPIPCVPEMVPSFWAPGPVIEGMNARLEELNRWAEEAVREEKEVHRIDLFTPFKKRLETPGASSRLYVDGLHPSPAGHLLIADELAEHLPL